MGLNDDGQMSEVVGWVNNRVVYAELTAFRQGAPVPYIAPIVMWGLARQFYTEQIEDPTAPGAKFMDCDPSLQLACILELVRRGALALDALVAESTSSLLAGIEDLLRPGSEIDSDEPAGYEEAPDA